MSNYMGIICMNLPANSAHGMELCIEACCVQIMHLIPFQTDESCCTIFFYGVSSTEKFYNRNYCKMRGKQFAKDDRQANS